MSLANVLIFLWMYRDLGHAVRQYVPTCWRVKQCKKGKFTGGLYLFTHWKMVMSLETPLWEPRK